MTLRPTKTSGRLRNIRAAVLLALPAAFLNVSAEAATPLQHCVYPRAGVSSDAYRTPPQLLAQVSARPLAAARRSELTQLAASKQSPQVVTATHHSVTPVSNSQPRQSVRSELQKLYEQEGRQMPQMITPSRSQRPMPQNQPTAGGNRYAAPPIQAQPTQKSGGLLSGLFDFGRFRTSSRSSGRRSKPPVEPNPYRPPTYRDQQRMQQARQRAAAQQPNVVRPDSNVAAQQPAAQSAQSKSVIELKRVTPNRNLTSSDEFFPDEATHAPATTPREQAALANPRTEDGLEEFFPEDDLPVDQAPAAMSVDIAADVAGEKLQQQLSGSTATTGDAFQMPVQSDEPIIPQPAPAAVSDAVTTTVTPPAAASPEEPAPFFADSERAINPDETLEVAELTGQTFDPSGADSKTTAGRVTDAAPAGSRMQQIAARDGVGLKGYCPVALRDERRLADGKAAYVSYYQGKAYYFSSAQAKETFDLQPADYSPASAGEDVTMKTLSGEVVDGSLDHSVWYKGRLYLFHSADTLKTFMAAPAAMAITD